VTANLKPDISTEFTINEGKPLDLGSIGGLCGPKLPYRGPLKIRAPDGTTVTFDDVLIESVEIVDYQTLERLADVAIGDV